MVARFHDETVFARWREEVVMPEVHDCGVIGGSVGMPPAPSNSGDVTI